MFVLWSSMISFLPGPHGQWWISTFTVRMCKKIIYFCVDGYGWACVHTGTPPASDAKFDLMQICISDFFFFVSVRYFKLFALFSLLKNILEHTIL